MSEDYLTWPVYGLDRELKRQQLSQRLNWLTQHHAQNCVEYQRILKAYAFDLSRPLPIEELPFLPVRLFKMYALRSVPEQEVIKTLTSSGTTSQAVSRIFLDRQTSTAQSNALVKILQSFLGTQRLPMLIIDHPGVVADRRSFSARAAGILGLSTFGRQHTYVLHDESMALNLPKIEEFLEKHQGQKLFVFGFTYMVWKYLLEALKKENRLLSLNNSILIHSGGWKKLQEEAVSNAVFKEITRQRTGIEAVHNFYGMVEQVGSIFMECEAGHLHAPAFADILIRDPQTWAVLPFQQRGIVQVLSALPTSYPGHSLLTEDLGIIHGEDDCSCGRLGKYFSIQGRLPRAEIRGCSDTHAENVRGGLHA